jgi:prefoldin subunit 5
MIEKRLLDLRAELEKGLRQMEMLDRRRSELRDTILRIEGAIQVLEDLQSTAGAVERPTLARTS